MITAVRLSFLIEGTPLRLSACGGEILFSELE
jgi:hypothetical protein